MSQILNRVTAAQIGAITTLAGDTGTASGLVINVIANHAANAAGSSVLTTASASTLVFHVTDASFNTLIGNLAGNLTLSGSLNTGLGYESLHGLTTGLSNVAFGNSSMIAATTATECVAIGSSSLDGLLTGINVIAIGYLSGSALVGAESNDILIGNIGTAAQSGAIHIGTAGTHTATYIAGVEGVAVANTNMVTINTATGQMGSQAIPSSGGIVTIDGDTGSVTGSTVSFTGLTTAGATVSFSGSGTAMLLNTSNTVLNNTFVGFGSGNNSTTSNQSTAFGSSSLTALGAGNYNNAFGNNVLNAVISGDANCAFGTDSQFLHNGSNNVSMGHLSLFNMASTGSNNTCIGHNAGINYTGTESTNILLGYSVGGTVGENGVIRIGIPATYNATYIAGINGNTVANTQMVTINSSTDQLGTAPIPGVGTNIFLSYVSAYQNNVTGNTVQYQVIFDSVQSNPGGYYNTGTGVFTAPVTGSYFFNTQIITGEIIGSGYTRAIMFLQTTAWQYKFEDIIPVYNTITGNQTFAGTCMARMTAGDTAYVIIWYFGGSQDVSVAGGAISSQQLSFFSGYYVSA
jgi:hypothetical protein